MAPTNARGSVDINLLDGSLSARIKGLNASAYELWLMGQDRRTLRLGQLKPIAGQAVLDMQLDRKALEGFNLSRIAVTPAGKTPEQGIVISGSPELLQRLYYSDKPWTVAAIGQETRTADETSAAPLEFLLPKIAHAAGGSGNLKRVLGEQIAKGREVFINETFEGNGRTCATCHRPDNNHTIDHKYIAKLPKDDPLFVAESNPALKELENPKQLRQFGLILANLDGFDQPGVLRSVPHTLALNQSMTVEHCAKLHPEDVNNPNAKLPPKGEFCEDEVFAHALGWSGDGSPGSGSLREFTLGAVAQHLPRTLHRQPGLDFRLPSDDEQIGRASCRERVS
jgi:hypothetical protein